MRENERMRTVRAYNLHLINEFDCGYDGVPELRYQRVATPRKMIGFNYAKTVDRKKRAEACCHFFLDDYQFERVWSRPESYVCMLRQFESVCTPDFSLYTDMPMPMQRWNIYRSRALGMFWQREGINVVPTLSWSTPESYSFCFDGIPMESTVAVSTIGVMNDATAYEAWCYGMDEALYRLAPSTVLIYGKMPDFDFQGTKVKNYANEVTERMTNGRKRKQLGGN